MKPLKGRQALGLHSEAAGAGLVVCGGPVGKDEIVGAGVDGTYAMKTLRKSESVSNLNFH